MIYIGMDDTDMPQTRGTGHLARQIADAIAEDCDVVGVSRHQLLRDPRVPMTKNNSSNVIHICRASCRLELLADRIRELMLAEFIAGSDPGLCVCEAPAEQQIAFGFRAKQELVTQADGTSSLGTGQCVHACLGGTGDGIIGAIAGVGLAASGNDGRFVQIGGIRALADAEPVQSILDAGVVAVRTVDGAPVHDGIVLNCGKLRPEIIDHRPVVIVEQNSGGAWRHVRRD